MLELDLNLDEFDLPLPEAGEGQLRLDDVQIDWRFPTARDLADLARTGYGAPEIRGELLRRCIRRVLRDNRPLMFEEWPDNLAAEVGVVMTSADPLLDPKFEFTCHACRHSWTVRFDIAMFLWGEIDDLARRLMSEVHYLAMAYGWSETETLGLTAARRAAYLQMCGR